MPNNQPWFLTGAKPPIVLRVSVWLGIAFVVAGLAFLVLYFVRG